MAKTKGPLLSMEAHGSLMKTLNFSQRKSGSQCRKYNKPLIAASAAQRGQRRLTEFLVAQWQNMSDADKATWATNAAASGLSLPGYHYFLRQAQRNLYTHHGLCGYWSLNEIVNNQVLDISGNGLHGTLEPTPPGDAPTLATGKSTRFSNCLLFDGNNDYVAMPTSPKLIANTHNFSVEVWAKSTAVNCLFFSTRLSSSEKGYDIVCGSNSTEGCICFRVYGDFAAFTGEWNAPLGEWWHIVGVINRTTNAIRMFVNGKLKGVSNIAGIGNITNSQDFYLARRGTTYYTGLIDEVCIYNRALSTAEIATRYKFGIAKV